MRNAKFVNIPIFIPELACPHQCVFCNQKKISGSINVPAPSEINNIIDQYLSSVTENTFVQIAFFGGSFTGIDFNLQEQYLQQAHKYIVQNKVNSIRISTRPDYIDTKILDLLKKYGVKNIELGAQSTNNEVLVKAGRGHSFDDIKNASRLIKSYGFSLGLQMMVGLPGDSIEKTIQTANDIVELKADNTRIYPTLIIKDTALEKMFFTGKYTPLTIDEAVIYAKAAFLIFEKNNITVLRVGLHPSEEISPEKSFVAGPLHNSFKELLMTSIWENIIENKIEQLPKGSYCFKVNNKQVNYAVGYKKQNLDYFAGKSYNIKFKQDPTLSKYQIDDCNN